MVSKIKVLCLSKTSCMFLVCLKLWAFFSLAFLQRSIYILIKKCISKTGLTRSKSIHNIDYIGFSRCFCCPYTSYATLISPIALFMYSVRSNFQLLLRVRLYSFKLVMLTVISRQWQRDLTRQPLCEFCHEFGHTDKSYSYL